MTFLMEMNNNQIIRSLNSLSKACQELLEDKVFLDKYNLLLTNLINTIKNENTIFICGNGGSFADAQHLVTELVVRFNHNRKALKAIALGSNQSNLTAIGNDMDFEKIFQRELEAFYRNGDTVLLLSTSGNSKNLIRVAEYLQSKDKQGFSIIGKDGGLLKKTTEYIFLPYENTALIQELQIMIGHSLCSEIEKEFLVK
tara:strand:- start:5815 stop:6411 length:597 start_codon:yes stop_codon:yes gene_type:complete